MKKILVILDGVADLPCKEFNDKTPLEAADTPNLDFLAKNGKTGLMYVSKQKIPQSGVVLNILGYQSVARGLLEAIGSGIRLRHGDLCLRVNFATKKDKKIVDRRAGRDITEKEARSLAKAINKKVKLGFPFTFYPTMQHRAVLVVRGGFSDNISDADPEYSMSWQAEPLDEDEVTKLSANTVNSFMDQANKILERHDVNRKREKRNLLQANCLIVRGAGVDVPELEKRKDWVAIVTMPTEIGIARLTGMYFKDLKLPKLKNYDIYKNLYERLDKQIKIAKKVLPKYLKKYDTVYIHFKETDIPGHDNKPLEKKRMIEILDKNFFGFVKNLKDIKIIVTADHSTPCKLKSHSSDPVPLLIYGVGNDDSKKFTESDCKSGSIGTIYAQDFMKRIA